MKVIYTILFFILGCIGFIVAIRLANWLMGQVILFFDKRKRSKSPYFKIKQKLEDDLRQANFSGDWRRRQEINLHLLWLKTLYEVESRDMFGHKKDENEITLLATLSFDDIKFPLKWKLDDFYCYPLSQVIISAYGKVLAENDYKGMFKPESILPVPKNYIRKAILFTFDYFNFEKPIYVVPDKDKRAENLNGVNSFLYMSFIDTGNDDLPKSGTENYKMGNIIKEKLPEHNELEDLNLVDWRTETDWMVRGVHYADKERYDYAFACYEQAKKLNPENKDLKAVISLTYLHKGEQHYENGENELAFENIRKAAELKNEGAVKWLEEHSNN